MAQPLPELAPVLEAARLAPPIDLSLPVAQLRAASDAGVVAAGALVRPAGPLDVEDLLAGDVPVRVYRPAGQAGTPDDAVHVHVHGGGWWMGSLETTDAMARELSSVSGLTVVSVGYRLAPEHPYPAGLDDVYAVLCWAEQTLRPGSLSIGGESAGSNLAAAACLLSRDRGGPALVAQWLDIPAVDLTLPDTASLRAYAVGHGLDLGSFRPMLDWYAGEQARATDPYLSPVLTDDLTGLPPAIITTAELDPVRDQGHAYAAALRAAGVPVEHSDWAGHLHGTMWLTGLTESAREWHASCVSSLLALHVAARQVAA